MGLIYWQGQGCEYAIVRHCEIRYSYKDLSTMIDNLNVAISNVVERLDQIGARL